MKSISHFSRFQKADTKYFLFQGIENSERNEIPETNVASAELTSLDKEIQEGYKKELIGGVIHYLKESPIELDWDQETLFDTKLAKIRAREKGGFFKKKYFTFESLIPRGFGFQEAINILNENKEVIKNALLNKGEEEQYFESEKEYREREYQGGKTDEEVAKETDLQNAKKIKVWNVVNELTGKRNSTFEDISFELKGVEGMEFAPDEENKNIDWNKEEGVFKYKTLYKGQKITIGIPLSNPDLRHFMVGVNNQTMERISPDHLAGEIRTFKRDMDEMGEEYIQKIDKELDKNRKDVRIERERWEALNRKIEESKK